MNDVDNKGNFPIGKQKSKNPHSKIAPETETHGIQTSAPIKEFRVR